MKHSIPKTRINGMLKIDLYLLLKLNLNLINYLSEIIQVINLKKYRLILIP